jgi:hypothetical protein
VVGQGIAHDAVAALGLCAVVTGVTYGLVQWRAYSRVGENPVHGKSRAEWAVRIQATGYLVSIGLLLVAIALVGNKAGSRQGIGHDELSQLLLPLGIVCTTFGAILLIRDRRRRLASGGQPGSNRAAARIVGAVAVGLGLFAVVLGLVVGFTP